MIEKDENFLPYCTAHIILNTSSYFQEIRKHRKHIYLKLKMANSSDFKNTQAYIWIENYSLKKSLLFHHCRTTSRPTFNAHCLKILYVYICFNRINFHVDFLLKSLATLANTDRYLGQRCLFRFNRVKKKITPPK